MAEILLQWKSAGEQRSPLQVIFLLEEDLRCEDPFAFVFILSVGIHIKGAVFGEFPGKEQFLIFPGFAEVADREFPQIVLTMEEHLNKLIDLK